MNEDLEDDTDDIYCDFDYLSSPEVEALLDQVLNEWYRRVRRRQIRRAAHARKNRRGW